MKTRSAFSTPPSAIDPLAGRTSNPASRYLATRLLLLLLLGAWPAEAGTIRGVARDDRGIPLEGVRVCLLPRGQDEAPGGSCGRARTTNRKGKFTFHAVDVGRYVLAVEDDGAGNHVWAPPSRTVRITTDADLVRRVRFERRFGFGNFRPEITVTAAAIPELPSFDLREEIVFLRLFVTDPTALEPSERVVFLGRVKSADTFAIKLSLPWTFAEIGYEIFSPARSAAGFLPVEE